MCKIASKNCKLKLKKGSYVFTREDSIKKIQCCGSGMFISDPAAGFSHPESWAPNPRSRVKKAPDAGSESATLNGQDLHISNIQYI